MSMSHGYKDPYPHSTNMLMDRCRLSLDTARKAADCSERYFAAHMAALRAAAVVCSVRGRPASRGDPRSVWEVLPRIAPELAAWASIFSTSATRRDGPVTDRDADDLLANAEAFRDDVVRTLGLTAA